MLKRTVYKREEKPLSNTNAGWFREFALHVREIVVEHGGVIVMTQDELIEAVTQRDDKFKDCPPAVLYHPTLPLRKWAQLESSTYITAGEARAGTGILLIHFEGMNRDEAHGRVEEDGLSEAVHIKLLETSTS